MLKVCIDTNVWIIGIMFNGKTAEVITTAFNRKFKLVLSKIILDEVERNLLNKFKFSQRNIGKLIHRILQIADLYEPIGSIKVIPNRHADNLVLETATQGKARYLITGDREHLLPLKIFRKFKILVPNKFVTILKN